MPSCCGCTLHCPVSQYIHSQGLRLDWLARINIGAVGRITSSPEPSASKPWTRVGTCCLSNAAATHRPRQACEQVLPAAMSVVKPASTSECVGVGEIIVGFPRKAAQLLQGHGSTTTATTILVYRRPTTTTTPAATTTTTSCSPFSTFLRRQQLPPPLLPILLLLLLLLLPPPLLRRRLYTTASSSDSTTTATATNMSRESQGESPAKRKQ